MWQPLFLICVLPSEFTVDHASGRSIRRKTFSKLKLIKTYFRSSIQQKRLNSLTITSIESKSSRGLNLDKVLKGTADAKARKIRFY